MLWLHGVTSLMLLMGRAGQGITLRRNSAMDFDAHHTAAVVAMPEVGHQPLFSGILAAERIERITAWIEHKPNHCVPPK